MHLFLGTNQCVTIVAVAFCPARSSYPPGRKSSADLCSLWHIGEQRRKIKNSRKRNSTFYSHLFKPVAEKPQLKEATKMDDLKKSKQCSCPEKRKRGLLVNLMQIILFVWMASFITACGGSSPSIAFSSKASNLMSGDTNDKTDIFAADILSGKTFVRIMASDGSQPNGQSGRPSISSDGSYIAFASEASNLVPGDTNGKQDIFIAETSTGRVLKRITTQNGEQPNDESTGPSISADGKVVAFSSFAGNLVPGDTNGNIDVFIADVQTGRVVRRIVHDDDSQNGCGSDEASLSKDGKYVAFISTCSSFLPYDINAENSNQSCVFIANTTSGKAVARILASNGSYPNAFPYGPSLNSDGKYVAFSSHGTNLVDNLVKDGKRNIFIGNRDTGRVVSYLAPKNYQNSFDPSISGNGLWVAFSSLVYKTQNMEDVRAGMFVGDRQSGSVKEILQANNQECGASLGTKSSVLSDDGSLIVFSCAMPNTYRDLDLYIGDTATGKVTKKIVASDGNDGNNESNEPSF
jgi:Tol biopolymer transport system component